MRTSFAQFHCSAAVGIFCCFPRQHQFHLNSLSRSTYVLDLVLVEHGHSVDDHPRERATKVDEFVHDERHDAGGEDIVANVCVPGQPHALKDVEVDIVC